MSLFKSARSSFVLICASAALLKRSNTKLGSIVGGGRTEDIKNDFFQQQCWTGQSHYEIKNIVNAVKEKKSMEFDNKFNVPVSTDEAWKILMDIERIAPCVPGAELTEEIVDEKTYKGKVSVKLGPVALTLSGQTSFDEIDEIKKSARLTAKGNDTKGRGGANATVSFHMEEINDGTCVIINTNLQLSGAVAQYGRGVGMVKDLAQQIIDQFAKNLRDNVITPSTSAAEGKQNTDGVSKGDSTTNITPAAPVQVGSMGLRVIWNAIMRGLRKLFGINN